MPEIDVKQMLDSPETSFWLRHAICELLQRDPLDAAQDAILLSEVMNIRADAAMADYARYQHIVDELEGGREKWEPLDS